MSYHVLSPVAVAIFNREEKAEKLYEMLRRVKPEKLYVIADGPRSEAEKEICEKTRAVFDRVDWSCEVIKCFAEKNIGCAGRIATGFTEVLKQEEYAIFLEDDCIPHEDFFRFCDELLIRYKDDQRVVQISGTNVMGSWDCGENSYLFARWGCIWGWATWARAWEHFDLEMEDWKNPEIQKLLRETLGKRVYENLSKVFSEHCCNSENITAWDYAWTFSRLTHSGLSITPKYNLITNIGSGEDATHTKDMGDFSMSSYSLDFPLKHPEYMIRDRKFEIQIEEKVMGIRPLWKKIIGKIKRTFK